MFILSALIAFSLCIQNKRIILIIKTFSYGDNEFNILFCGWMTAFSAFFAVFYLL